MKTQMTAGALVLAVLSLTGCFQAPAAAGPAEAVDFESMKVPQGFDFSTVRNVTLRGELSYPDGRAFAQGNLLIRQGSTVYQTVQTDAWGAIDATVGVPAGMTELEVVPAGMGVAGRWFPVVPGTSPLLLNLNEDQGSSPIGAAPSLSLVSRAAVAGSFRYLDSYTFDGQRSGVPVRVNQNLDGTKRPRVTPSPELLATIDDALPENRSVPAYHPEYLDVTSMTELSLAAQAEVWVTFLHEGAGYRNALAYFVFDTTKPPRSASEVDVSDIVVAFPNVSLLGSGGGLVSGDTVQLKNPRRMDNADPADDGLFDPGLSVGWVLVANGYANTNVVNTATRRYFSLPQLNEEVRGGAVTPENSYKDRTHVAFLALPGNASYLLGFEDLSRVSGDNDFNDAVFSVAASPVTAVATSVTVPHPYLVGQALTKGLKSTTAVLDSDSDGVSDSRDEFPNDPGRASRQVYPSAGNWGTLLYEDRWPNLGDYDFNDLVVEWQYEATFSAQGRAVDLTLRFRPLAAGAGYANGFAVALPFSPTSVEAVQGGAENSRDQIVLPVLDNVHAWFQVQGLEDKRVNTIKGGLLRPVDATIERRVVFAAGSSFSASQLGSAPFDPFLVVNVTADGRGREVHLPGKPATDKASAAWVAESGTQDYLTANGLPWALNVVSQTPWTQEQVQLTQGHRYFRAWAESAGRDFSDWYEDKPGYRNVQKLFR